MLGDPSLTVQPSTRSKSQSSSSSSGSAAKIENSVAEKHFPHIEGYQIQGILGQGGMGIVYRAVQSKLNRTVALKVLPAIVGTANPAAVSRFRREATAAGRLHHTNIIPIYDFGQSHDSYYYAMELIEGQPLSVVIGRLGDADVSSASPVRLAQVLSSVTHPILSENLATPETSDPPTSSAGTSTSGRGKPYFAQVARWIADAAEALHYAHGEGIVHRDIKPGNLILSNDGRIMIADFGLAKSEEEESFTMTGSLLGTLRYLSPEQAMAKRMHVDHRTDIYSLGATMYELLCFKPAFPGEDQKEILGAIISKEPVAPRKIIPAVPHELETICLKTLEKSADSRYPTARALAEDLRRYLNDLPIVARRPNPLERAVKFVRRHKAPAISVTCVLLLLATTWFLFEEKEKKVRAQVEQLVEEGLRWHIDRKWDDAASLYAQALEVDAENLRAIVNLAIVKKEQFNSVKHSSPRLLEEALQLCERALVLNPSAAETWNLKGVLMKKLGRYAEAAIAYQRSVQINSQGDGYSNLGVVQILSGNLVDGEKSLDEARQAARKTEPCRWKMIWRNLAALQLQLGKSEALANVSQAVECEKMDFWSWLLRARVHLELPTAINAENAVEDAKLADRLADNKKPISQRVLGLARLRNQEFAKAAESAQEALDAGDFPAFNHLVLACAHAKLNEREIAKEHFQKALSQWPEKLKTPDSYLVSADDGILWFESGKELFTLKHEAANLLDEQ